MIREKSGRNGLITAILSNIKIYQELKRQPLISEIKSFTSKEAIWKKA